MTDSTRRAPRIRGVLGAPLSAPGSIPALLLFWFSLGASLLPRSPLMQGIVSGLSLAVGYAIGVFAWFVLRKLIRRHLPSGRNPGRSPTTGRLLVLLAFAAILLALVALWPSWQTVQGRLVGVDPLGTFDGIAAASWTLLAAAVLLMLGRSIRWLVWRIDVGFERRFSVNAARAVTTALVAAVLAAFSVFLTSGGLAAFANARFAPSDAKTLDGITRPAAPEVSGSPDSLVEWDDLGYQGRTFTGSATAVDDIAAFYGDSADARAPIRVYAGLNSASSSDARARLVVDELNRTGAADRSVVAVVAVTGTGWVDPTAAAALEYLHRGDTAIAAMQYSFLPSWISFVLDTATSTEAGEALTDAVVAWWRALPEGHRPRLVAFGESLGSLGSEAAFARSDLESSLASIGQSVDGVLWVGPTAANPVRTQLLAARDPASPVWLPVYDAGRTVRFADAPGVFPVNDDDWSTPRVAYYHHASDPVGYWDWATLWRPPEWTDAPVGPDVPESVRWVPFTTFTQVVVDLINGFSAAVGHGHNYNDVFVEGWTVVAPVPGWGVEDTAKLQAHLESLPLPGL